MKTGVLLAATALSLVVAGPASAALIAGLYNTGVDSSGNQLADGVSDGHYLLNTTGAPVVYTNSLYLTVPDAKFIAAQADGGYSSAPNLYTLSFDLSAYDASTASISGFTAADNGVAILLNGNFVAAYASPTDLGSFQSLHPFSVSSGFLAGINKLSFQVADFGPPSALLVSGLTGTAAAVPEPATWGLMLVGFGLMGAAIRRRNVRTSVRFA